MGTSKERRLLLWRQRKVSIMCWCLSWKNSPTTTKTGLLSGKGAREIDAMNEFYYNALPVAPVMRRIDLCDLELACLHLAFEVERDGAPRDNKWRRLHDRLEKQLEEWDDRLETAHVE